MRPVLLLMPTTSYRAHDLLEASRRLGIDVVVGTDRTQALEELSPAGTITIRPADAAATHARVERLHRERPLDAILGVDDETVIVAAEVAARLGLRANPVAAVRAARDKHAMRQALAAAGAPGPWFRRIRISEAARLAGELPYPCVVKPLAASASRGVLRADGPEELVAAVERVAAILSSGDDPDPDLLVEGYLPGDEVALEGLLDEGRLRVLALFDKPEPLHGPTFEESIYTTPSRHSRVDRRAIERCVQEAVNALGLRCGPVHAEVRLAEGRATLLEIAPRTIGGLCGRSLRFAGGRSLEELVLRDAVGDAIDPVRESRASGVMMIPVPHAGRLVAVDGVEAAGRVARIDEVTISVNVGQPVAPPPEGHRYLGFIFASAPTAAEVERALRQAHERLEITVR